MAVDVAAAGDVGEAMAEEAEEWGTPTTDEEWGTRTQRANEMRRMQPSDGQKYPTRTPPPPEKG